MKRLREILLELFKCMPPKQTQITLRENNGVRDVAYTLNKM